MKSLHFVAMANPRLSKDEKAFLGKCCIPLHYVADMRDRADWASCSEFLHPLNCYVAWGFRTCAEGHRLTTARGICIECKPHSIAYMKGYWTPGHVYLLESQQGGLVKVGWTGNVKKRLRELRSERIGSLDDWQLVRERDCQQPALLEKAIHARLARYKERRFYMRHNVPRMANELFACSKSTAVRAWNEVVAGQTEW